MKILKNILSTVTFSLIVALLTVTIFPALALAQTQNNLTAQISAADRPDDLKTTFSRARQQRSNILIDGETSTDLQNIDFMKEARGNRAGSSGRSWARKNWWLFPVIAGVGVGIYFLVKNNSSSSGIRCNDGTISNAQNTQGACSYHGGIAR